MATTKLIERAVLKHFDYQSVAYHVSDNGSVWVALPVELGGGGITVQIADREAEGVDALGVLARITDFPQERMGEAAELCNRLNSLALGKFFFAKESVGYALDWVVIDGSDPENVRMMLSVAAYAIEKFYPAIMLMRWGNVSVERALAELNRNEDSGGGSDPGILTDADIRRLLDAD